MTSANPCGACGARDRYPSGPCRPCTNRRNAERVEHKKAWARAKRAADPERARELERVRRGRVDPEVRRARQDRFKENNPNYFREYRRRNAQIYTERTRKWREANPDKARQATHRWRSDNWVRVLASLQRRRALRQGATGTCTVEQAHARYTYYGGKCWMCGEQATCMDHVKALALGGSNWPANLRPACTSCNSRKGAREGWIKRRDFPR